MRGRALLALVLICSSGSGAAVAAAVPRTASLTAGAAAVEVVLPDGTPLAGYGGFPRRVWFPDVLGRHAHAFWFRPAQGVSA